MGRIPRGKYSKEFLEEARIEAGICRIKRIRRKRMTQNPVRESLMKAIIARRTGKGLLHHSDRGAQYFSHVFRKILSGQGIIASMSRKGNWYDNMPNEPGEE